MEGKIVYGINPQFLEFLDRLENKREGEPLIFWQESIDFLTVFIGGGDCRRYALGGWVAQYLDIVYRRHPQKNEDPFIGFEISGGIRMFLRHDYKNLLGDRYGEFKIQHNGMRYEYHASELLEKWLKEFPPKSLPEIEWIRGSLKQQNPSIHIPL